MIGQLRKTSKPLGVGRKPSRRLVKFLLDQLAHLSDDEMPLDRLIAAVPECEAAIGWNRLVAHFERSSTIGSLIDSLECRLNASTAADVDAAFEIFPDGLIEFDAGHVVRINPAAVHLLQVCGASEEPPLKVADCLSCLGVGAAGEELLPDICETKPVAEPPLHLRLQRIRYAGDGARGAWIVRDVTQRALADRNREDFVATATHELRTPLSNISAYAESLAMSQDLDFNEQKRFLNVIDSEAKRLGRFIDDLLGVTQMQAGAAVAHHADTDVRRLLEEAYAAAKPLADEKQQTFDLVLAAKLPVMRLDKDKIGSAIANLLSNAVKYTPAGERVTLSATAKDDVLSIAVIDSGCGISESDRQRLGQRFFRSTDARVQDQTGSGIGLAFCFEVAKLHGGRIEVTSELDRGSEFQLLLPLNLAVAGTI